MGLEKEGRLGRIGACNAVPALLGLYALAEDFEEVVAAVRRVHELVAPRSRASAGRRRSVGARPATTASLRVLVVRNSLQCAACSRELM